MLGTRATPAQAALVQAACPGATYDPISRLLKLEKHNKPLHGQYCRLHRRHGGHCRGRGSRPDRRVLRQQSHPRLRRRRQRAAPPAGEPGANPGRNCVVAVAGMEGALASVIGGLVQNPVIAVPTSVGYGASFGGVSALLTMINSCANGIATVNIDNGYGAGYLATQINRLALGAKE